jgi:Zn finger protein HypA/HybF involved in hydrogenase expression
MELSDIVGLKIECIHCQTTVALSRSKDIRVESFRHCPNCNEPWFQLPGGSTIELSVKKFVEAL